MVGAPQARDAQSRAGAAVPAGYGRSNFPAKWMVGDHPPRLLMAVMPETKTTQDLGGLRTFAAQQSSGHSLTGAEKGSEHPSLEGFRLSVPAHGLDIWLPGFNSAMGRSLSPQ